MESEIPVSVGFEGRGKWTKVERIGSISDRNDMPKVRVPRRYLRTYFAESKWPGEGSLWYFARIDVMTEISGREQEDSHWSEPTRDWYFVRSSDFACFVIGTEGTESTGKPER